MSIGQIDPLANALTLARTYGFAPIFAAPIALPALYPPITSHPASVTAVTPIARDARTHETLGRFYDRYV